MEAVSRGVRSLENRWRPGVHVVSAPPLKPAPWKAVSTLGQEGVVYKTAGGTFDILSDAALALAGVGLIAQSEGDAAWNFVGWVAIAFGAIKLVGDIAVITSVK